MHSLFSVVLILASVFWYSFLTQNVCKDTDDMKFSVLNGSQLNSSIWVGDAGDEREIILNQYLKGEALKKVLLALELKFITIVKTHKLGVSAVYKEILWAVQISTNVQNKREFLKPMFKYVANIHGDHAVGNALMVSLAHYLAYSYDNDDRITRLLNTTDIWIIPSMNPDGFRRSNESHGFPTNGYGIDLDRQFPDKFVGESLFKKKKNKEDYEVLIMGSFIFMSPFVLSGNLQGGAIVVNYPYDNAEASAGYRQLSLTPDNKVFVKLAKEYAQENPMMLRNAKFSGGIVNGNYWNKKSGSMQDYNYAFSNCFELTFYLSCVKYPPAADLPIYWHANLESMLNFMESTRRGVYGQVRDTSEKALHKAVIVVEGNSKEIVTTSRGEYWRLLVPGIYNITASARGYTDVTEEVEVPEKDSYVRQDFILMVKKRSLLPSNRK